MRKLLRASQVLNLHMRMLQMQTLVTCNIRSFSVFSTGIDFLHSNAFMGLKESHAYRGQLGQWFTTGVRTLHHTLRNTGEGLSTLCDSVLLK